MDKKDAALYSKMFKPSKEAPPAADCDPVVEQEAQTNEVPLEGDK